MWYGDPRDARRAARRAYRDSRRAYRYRYGRPGGGILGLLFVLFIIFYVFTHILAWLIIGIFVLAFIGIVLWLLPSGLQGSRITNYLQTPQSPQPYPPHSKTQQSYPSYQQGYPPPPTAHR